MPKHLYEEALADVRNVKQVAEDHAKRTILEAVIPRIREFIDQAILNDVEVDEESTDGEPIPPRAPSAPLGSAPESEVTDIVAVDPAAQLPVDSAGPAAAITPPDAEGKVTLDIDSLCSTQPGVAVPPPMFGAPETGDEGTEYEINLESLDALRPIVSSGPRPALTVKALGAVIKKIDERVNLFGKTSKVVRSTPAFNLQIAQMIARVEDMYDHVQEQVSDPAMKSRYETMLESSFTGLNKLQESTKMSQNRKQINEADVTLKLTGLPDDIDLDTVGVDLITGEEDEEGMEAGDGEDLGGLDDMGGQGADQEGGEPQMESRRLSDDTIVEIDEKMLRREIARMRSLREEHNANGGSETKAQSWGNGPDNFDAFGGGKSEGEPTDADIVDKSDAPGSNPLGEGDDQDLEEGQDDLDESDDQDLDESDDQDLDEADMPAPPAMDQIGNRSKESQYGSEVSDGHATETWDKRRHEGLKRLGFEKKLQERAKARAASLKKEAATARTKKNAKRFNECKKEYQLVAKRFNESVERAKKVTQIVAKATQKLQEARSNSGSARPAGNTADNASLRKKLAETNLFNAKLLYTNKLLQLESLTARQKAQVIKQLDGVKSVREAKLVFESLTSTLAGSSSKTVNENADRKVLGSSSRSVRPASTPQTLNEGYEASRWAQLAGITKR